MNQYNITLIKNYIKEKGLTKIEFCKSCDISQSCLNNIINGSKNIRLKTLRKILNFLKVKADDFLMLK